MNPIQFIKQDLISSGTLGGPSILGRMLTTEKAGRTGCVLTALVQFRPHANLNRQPSAKEFSRVLFFVKSFLPACYENRTEMAAHIPHSVHRVRIPVGIPCPTSRERPTNGGSGLPVLSDSVHVVRGQFVTHCRISAPEILCEPPDGWIVAMLGIFGTFLPRSVFHS